VQHRHGSDRNVTPEGMPESGSSVEAGERIVTGADLTPRRIAGKFPGVGRPMVGTSNPNADETTLQPARDEGEEESRFGSAPPSPRWHAFQQNIRENLNDIRAHCLTCCRPSQSRVA